MNRELGRLTSEVQRLLQRELDFFDDPITIQSGCADEFAPAIRKATETNIERTLRRAGYEFYAEFIAEVEARTTPLWVFNSALTALSHGTISHAPFFEYEDQEEACLHDYHASGPSATDCPACGKPLCELCGSSRHSVSQGHDLSNPRYWGV